MDDIGERIKKQRERRGWTIRELGRHAKVDAGWISRLEAGERRNISIEAAARIALALGVSVDYIAGVIDRPQPWDSREASQESELEPTGVA